ncbi:flagellin [Tranquillimonas rosea]|uniref:Flagellin n=1 Tax=Tranquillimonas rosea TaxID=641238 RepID=A0A1H9X4U0_9RHOB|nr:flagellin [Tranquillimonas rosea]SES41228.1 flagellin [Tranquillimonas rosea]
MSSILTNTGAMVALQSLKSINKNLAATQSEISTGKSIATAKDNSAVWAISKVMESDVEGFKAVSDSLALGESTVAVARSASETVTDLLKDMKKKITSAQGDNVDLAKLDADVQALKGQITSVVGAAQFNGLNLVDGSTTTINVLSSLNRDSTGNVTAANIAINGQNLSTAGYAANDVFSGSSNGASALGDTVALALSNGDNEQIEIAENGAAFAQGDRISFNIGEQQVSYTVTAEDAASTTTADIVAVNLKSQIDELGIAGLTVDYDSGTPGTLDLTMGAGADLTITGQWQNNGAGLLGQLGTLSVSSAANATAALGAIDGLITNSVNAAAAFGSVQGRLETQSDFVSSLTDSLKTGIGALVDADMEETSARLQALQTQQQLGIQSLSIANQAPQSILSLFR